MEKGGVKVRCQRIGCDAMFYEDDNPDGSCRYHDLVFQTRALAHWAIQSNQFFFPCKPRVKLDHWHRWSAADGCSKVLDFGAIHKKCGTCEIRTVESHDPICKEKKNTFCIFCAGPLFHDGMKEWSCCKKRSHDFSLFLEIPGCKTGKHTTEKQVVAPVNPVKENTVPAPTAAPSTNASSKDSCSRCRQGFFCSDHGSQSKPVSIVGDKPVNASADDNSSVLAPKPPKKIVDINEPQVCKNKGCGQTFKEKDNHDSACSYHPGPAIFHDRKRGWKCCDIHVKEFDEFMSIPPCTKGWHNADP